MTEMTPIESSEIEMMKKELRTNVRTNSLNKDEFKEQFMLVFKTMADLLSNTLGPYGSHTMIDNKTSYCMTKDGFHVLQYLHFASMEQERIRTTLYNISHQMVMKVGDGSTSAVLAAYEFLTTMNDAMKNNESVFSTVRPKVINNTIKRVVDVLCERIAKDAEPVTDENYLNVVERIASIATNENAKYTKMITEIYKNYGKDININLEMNSLAEDEVIARDDMYESTCKVLDSAFFNRDKYCDIDNPIILMFDHVLEGKYWDLVLAVYNYIAQPQQRQLLVIAPGYDDFYLDSVRADIMKQMDAAKLKSQALRNFPIVHIRNYLTSFLEEREMYLDLAALLGATALTPKAADDAYTIFKNYEKNLAVEYNKLRQDPAKIKEANEYVNTHANKCTELKEIFANAVGTCGLVSAGVKFTYFSKFTPGINPLLETRKQNALIDLQEKEAKYAEEIIPATDLIRARTRYNRITCKFVTIKVGGANEMEKVLNNDSVDDAIKAAKSAIRYGYNEGCNYAIIRAAYLYEKENTYTDNIKIGDDSGTIIEQRCHLSTLELTILHAISKAFINVYKRVLRNGIGTEEKVNEIAEALYDSSKGVYNLATNQYDQEDAVINSSKTDIEILKGAIEMVSIVLTCNQYISQAIKV